MSAEAIIQVEDLDVFLQQDGRDVGIHRSNREQDDREDPSSVLDRLLPTAHYPLKDSHTALEFCVVYILPIEGMLHMLLTPRYPSNIFFPSIFVKQLF